MHHSREARSEGPQGGDRPRAQTEEEPAWCRTPHNPNDWTTKQAFVADVVAGELGVALGQIDEQVQEQDEPF